MSDISQQLLDPPTSPNKIPTKDGNSSGKVLTNIENIQMIEERGKMKLKPAESMKGRNLERRKQRG